LHLRDHPIAVRRSVTDQSALDFVDQLSIYQSEIFSHSFILESIIVPMKKGFGLLKRKRSKIPKVLTVTNGADEKMDGLPNHVGHQELWQS
jgi:hypothetical protein